MAGENEGQESVPDVEAIVAERTAALKQNTDQAIRELREARKKLQSFDGVDPTEYKTLKEQSAEAERKKALAEGNLEVWKKQVTDQHQKEIETKAAREKKLETALNKRLTSDELRKALTGKAAPEWIELLVEHGAKYVRMKETDEDFEQYVADEKGNPLVADGMGTPMTIDMFVDQSLKAKFPGAFLGTGSSGGGASRSSTGGAGGQKIISKDDLYKGDNLARFARGELKLADA